MLMDCSNYETIIDHGQHGMTSRLLFNRVPARAAGVRFACIAARFTPPPKKEIIICQGVSVLRPPF
jgi:hypothetical protein